MTNHVLKLKRLHVARDDETLRSLDMQKLTIDVLKSELLHRGLSTTHKKKEDLIKCLSSHLSKVLHVARDDETLRSLDMRKLTIDVLKSELLCRGLSTTHKKKEDLIERLSSHLSKVNN